MLSLLLIRLEVLATLWTRTEPDEIDRSSPNRIGGHWIVSLEGGKSQAIVICKLLNEAGIQPQAWKWGDAALKERTRCRRRIRWRVSSVVIGSFTPVTTVMTAEYLKNDSSWRMRSVNLPKRPPTSDAVPYPFLCTSLYLLVDPSDGMKHLSRPTGPNRGYFRTACLGVTHNPALSLVLPRSGNPQCLNEPSRLEPRVTGNIIKNLLAG